MGRFSEFISGMFVGEEDEDIYEVEKEEETSEKEEKPVRKRKSFSDDEPKKGGNIVNINATTQLEVVLVKPERFDDASGIADHLNSKRTVVLNLESTNKDIARRLVDFLSGVAYANGGQIKRVANSTFIITPYNVGVVGDLLDELENSGVYF